MKRLVRGIRNKAIPHNPRKGFNEACESLLQEISGGKKVVFITGRGLSVESGIPAFRGSPQALVQSFPGVQTWGLRKFLADPMRWYNEYWLPTHMTHIRALGMNVALLKQDTTSDEEEQLLGELAGKGQPHKGHYALAALAEKCNATILSQTTDGLITHCSKQTMHNTIEVYGRADAFRCVSPRCSEQNKIQQMDCVQLVLHPAQIIEHTNDPENPVTVRQGEGLELVEIPKCWCKRTVLAPYELFFDERPQDFNPRMWRDALWNIYMADVLVFVGCSFSSPLATEALTVGRRNGATIFSFDVRHSSDRSITTIVGPVSETLPAVLEKMEKADLTWVDCSKRSLRPAQRLSWFWWECGARTSVMYIILPAVAIAVAASNPVFGPLVQGAIDSVVSIFWSSGVESGQKMRELDLEGESMPTRPTFQ
eukprot:TRINITY_DN67076_c7_g1_i1.p1 TRINITY_DN67076_c7_g1~~TRINITY_DN67076_c7_g1_i1.p1  ORF type:complete len:425 (+),score=0.60 TRINITY_DN67076_c7_g1_i1:23-1297(+)